MVPRGAPYLHTVLAGVATACHTAARHAKDGGGCAGHEGQLGQVIWQPGLEHLCHGGPWRGQASALGMAAPRWVVQDCASGPVGRDSVPPAWGPTTLQCQQCVVQHLQVHIAAGCPQFCRSALRGWGRSVGTGWGALPCPSPAHTSMTARSLSAQPALDTT